MNAPTSTNITSTPVKTPGSVTPIDPQPAAHSPQKDEQQKDEILGYVKNVSPCKVSAKGSQYFSFNVVEKNRTVKALCFSPKRHKGNIDRKAESGIPCKITKFNRDPDEKDVVFINYNTNVDEAPETTVDYSLAARERIRNNTHPMSRPNTPLTEVENIQVYQLSTSVLCCSSVPISQKM